MKLAIRIALVIATCLGFVVLVPGCGNQNTASTPPQSAGCTSDAQCNGLKCASGECVQCTADSHCNSRDKCNVCSANKCVKKSNCCTDDTQCSRGQRCFNVRGRKYGSCRTPK